MDEGGPSLAMMDEKEKKIMAMGETRKDTALSSWMTMKWNGPVWVSREGIPVSCSMMIRGST
jgi:hypothetical protein